MSPQELRTYIDSIKRHLDWLKEDVPRLLSNDHVFAIETQLKQVGEALETWQGLERDALPRVPTAS